MYGSLLRNLTTPLLSTTDIYWVLGVEWRVGEGEKSGRASYDFSFYNLRRIRMFKDTWSTASPETKDTN